MAHIHFEFHQLLIDQPLRSETARRQVQFGLLAVLKRGQPDAEIDLAVGDDFNTHRGGDAVHDDRLGGGHHDCGKDCNSPHQKACPIEKKN